MDLIISKHTRQLRRGGVDLLQRMMAVAEMIRFHTHSCIVPCIRNRRQTTALSTLGRSHCRTLYCVREAKSFFPRTTALNFQRLANKKFARC
jgi:hypothetical protein